MTEVVHTLTGMKKASPNDDGSRYYRKEEVDFILKESIEALEDILSGWKYIRSTHGDLYGVGWDRAQNKAELAIEQLLKI